MDIKEYIDGLSEQEAKAVLAWYVTHFKTQVCVFCDFMEICCQKPIARNSDSCRILHMKHALQEAQR